ncbi:MAG: pyridoxal-phosphate dependent enzyme [Shewanella sp.]|uniref:1-aminocyclopropane-1-carboxylate deaminase/D-cysteine desulfhydrase n=1 Tax=Shewanella cutis TaxID=2766780 RepID=A0ABS9R0C5_9GAMM|nr:pyridoxal-phosphate dependent enzyme [Shewanella sp. PS-2]MCG9965161.1 1-aminocyclopropane-1-carboxylate deaminase/D-cysteine desulfhydrase [Shewanella sp. PS-2]
MLANSPVESFSFAGREIFLKRDDLLHPAFSGNKARKFAYFLDQEFAGVTKLIGHGSAQANSLYSLSALAKLKGWQCDFYVDHIASQVLTLPTGNYAAAIANGTNVIDLSNLLAANTSVQAGKSDWHCQRYIEQRVLPAETNALFIPEGGRCQYAEYGVSQLAAEIETWTMQQGMTDLKVFLPAGTGTTALFLNQYFMRKQSDIRVFTCAVVGGDTYLRQQFDLLNPNSAEHPQILNADKKYHFGKLYPEFYAMWQRICASGVQFELLYDPLGFMVLEKFLPQWGASPVMYIHQGGLLGNETMLPRYLRKFGRTR